MRPIRSMDPAELRRLGIAAVSADGYAYLMPDPVTIFLCGLSRSSAMARPADTSTLPETERKG